jgi:hypothetical protein
MSEEWSAVSTTWLERHVSDHSAVVESCNFCEGTRVTRRMPRSRQWKRFCNSHKNLSIVPPPFGREYTPVFMTFFEAIGWYGLIVALFLV